MSVKRHIGSCLKVISSPHIKAGLIEVTYENFSKKTMTTADFKQQHKDVSA